MTRRDRPTRECRCGMPNGLHAVLCAAALKPLLPVADAQGAGAVVCDGREFRSDGTVWRCTACGWTGGYASEHARHRPPAAVAATGRDAKCPGCGHVMLDEEFCGEDECDHVCIIERLKTALAAAREELADMRAGQANDDRDHRALTAELRAAREDEIGLRYLLWVRHSAKHFSILYGDDGEMQCGECLIDFKRNSAKVIRDRFEELSRAALKGAGPDAREEEKGE